MNIKTNLLEEYVNFVDTTRNKISILITMIINLFLFFLCFFKQLNEKRLFFRSNTKNR